MEIEMSEAIELLKKAYEVRQEGWNWIVQVDERFKVTLPPIYAVWLKGEKTLTVETDEVDIVFHLDGSKVEVSANTMEGELPVFIEYRRR